MANAISPVEDFWRGQTETEGLKLFVDADMADPRAKSIKESEAELLELMNSSEEEKRLAVANRMVKDGKADLGIAHIVLARSISELSDREKHYRAALKNSENQEFKSKTKAADFKSDMLHVAIALEFADVLFRNSKPAVAIEILQTIQANANALWLGQHIRDGLLTALTTYLISENRVAEARALLDIDPIPVADWYYLNALVKFQEKGDCIQSRSALSVALNNSVIIAINLTDEDDDSDEDDDNDRNDDRAEESYTDDDDDDDDKEADSDEDSGLNEYGAAEKQLIDWDYHYSQITLPAWQNTAGAMEWLCMVFDTKHTLFGAEEVPDEVRYKKWQREMEVAEAHIRREDFKSIKRSFKMALREADSLNDGGDMFLLTAKMLGAVLLENGNSLDDLKESFDKKIAWLDKQESDDVEGLFTSYSHFAKTLYEIGMVKGAKHCAKRAIDFYEKAEERKTDKLDYFYLSECLVIYGSLLSVEEQFEEAESVFSRLVSVQAEFLGDKHLNLVDGLAGQRFCLHQLKRHDEEQRVYERLKKIDEYFDSDDEYRYVCDAIPVEAH